MPIIIITLRTVPRLRLYQTHYQFTPWFMVHLMASRQEEKMPQPSGSRKEGAQSPRDYPCVRPQQQPGGPGVAFPKALGARQRGPVVFPCVGFGFQGLSQQKKMLPLRSAGGTCSPCQVGDSWAFYDPSGCCLANFLQPLPHTSSQCEAISVALAKASSCLT